MGSARVAGPEHVDHRARLEAAFRQQHERVVEEVRRLAGEQRLGLAAVDAADLGSLVVLRGEHDLGRLLGHLSADPIDAAAAIARGFHAEYPLLEEEVDLLFDLIAARLVTSVTMSASRRVHAEDNPYLAISERPAWTLLRKLDRMNPRFATAILRKACGFEAVPGARVVAAWIEANRKSLAPLLEKPAATYPAALVPYGDPTHPMTDSASTTFVRLGPSTATSAIASNKPGNASRMSTIRLMTSSTVPPK